MIDSSHRVALLHSICASVDERTYGLDPVQRLLPASEHIRDLTVALGLVAQWEDARGRCDALFELAVLVVDWLECEQREQAA